MSRSAPPLPYAASGAGNRPFESAAGRGAIATWLLYASAAFEVVSILVLVGDITLYADDTGDIVYPDWFVGVSLIAGLAHFVLYISTAVFFLRWLHLAHRNLIPLGARDLKYSPGWAVGYWFIPILHLFRPFQALRELLFCSTPSPGRVPTGDAAASQAAPTLLQLYWTAWILSSILNSIARRLTLRSDSIEAGSWVAIIAAVLAIPAALLCTRVIAHVNELQRSTLATPRPA